MAYQVVFSPVAEAQLAALYRYIAEAATPTTAARYVNAIIDYCESLETFPMRGTQRDDIRTGLRVTNYKRRALIAFTVDQNRVSILGVFYGGQDYETVLQGDFDEEE
jgi:plasmid stabilization system protein ParE